MKRTTGGGGDAKQIAPKWKYSSRKLAVRNSNRQWSAA